MGAVHFVDNYRSLALEALIATGLWFIALVIVSLLAAGWTRGLEQITTRWGNLVLGGFVLLVAAISGLLHLERWLLAVARRLLIGH